VHGRTYVSETARRIAGSTFFWSSSTFPPISDHQTLESFKNKNISDGIKTLCAVLDDLGGTGRVEAPKGASSVSKQDRGTVNSEQQSVRPCPSMSSRRFSSCEAADGDVTWQVWRGPHGSGRTCGGVLPCAPSYSSATRCAPVVLPSGFGLEMWGVMFPTTDVRI
jgi:hypothetical protein